MARTSRRRANSGLTPRLASLARALTRPELIGTLLVVLAAAAIPFLLPLAGVITEARDEIVRFLGLHAFSLFLLVASAGLIIAFRRTYWLSQHRRHLFGFLALSGVSAGLLGLWNPDRNVGGTDLAIHSAGGDLGRALISWPIGTTIWSFLILVGFILLWPKTSARILKSSPRVLVTFLQWVWKQKIYRLTLTGIHFLISQIAQRIQDRRTRNLSSTITQPTLSRPTRHTSQPSKPNPVPVSEHSEKHSDTSAAEHTTREELEPDAVEERPATQIPMDMDTPADQIRRSEDGWQLPPINILSAEEGRESRSVDNAQRAHLIVETLNSFGVDASVVQINEGPTVTQFGVEPGWDVKTKLVTERDAAGHPIIDTDGNTKANEVEISRTRIRVNRITALQNDLALALAAPALRIEAPVPGKPMVGIEVPNTSTSTVTMRSVMESTDYQHSLNKHSLPIALGVGVSGDPVVADLSTMPHLLIAGATGAGKSVCLNAIISGLLMHLSPEKLRLVMIDPKRVELADFADVPHLAFSRIVVEMDQVVGTLQAVINEMESRYRKFAKAGVRNIKSYNTKTNDHSTMPYWVVVIDELADLMIAAPYQVEQQLVRLAQLARATGIHLVVATQRPSVDVITGLIKANFPTRIAFSVASSVDSRTVLDQGGAEKLLGRGDMLYVPPDEQKTKRVQGVFVSDEEIRSIVDFWSADRFANLKPENFDALLQSAERDMEGLATTNGAEDDSLIQKAIALAKEHQTLSTSMLQRKLRIGYPRAARTMDDLEDRGIIGPADGTNSREVLIGNQSPHETDFETERTLAAEAANFKPSEEEEALDISPNGEPRKNQTLPEFPKKFDDE